MDARPASADRSVDRWRALVDSHRRLNGWLASVVLVAVVTGAIGLLERHLPVLSLGVLYLLAVLPVAVGWGLAYAVPVAVGSMLVFNFFFLEPRYTFTLADSRNWFVLGVFLVTAVVVSELAARSRRQARESALLAAIATSLLERGQVSGELDRIGADAAGALRVERAEIELGDDPRPLEGTAERYPLEVAGRQVGTISLSGPRRPSTAARRRVLPALASLLGVAIDRERLAREALEAEALRRSDAMKTAVLRSVSHDLRTPLMAILTSASALAREDLRLDRTDRRELVATILGEATRLDHLVGNLLDLSRLQAGAAQPDADAWAVDDLVVQALNEIGEAGRRVEVAFPEESAAVRVDAHQIQRALVNLIENALHYSTPPDPVRIQMTQTDADVLIRIVDRGPGIPPRELESIFQPFQRGRQTAATPGAGLGLAITRGFAEANGGRVWAESRAGQGATFVLALPAVQVPAAVAT